MSFQIKKLVIFGSWPKAILGSCVLALSMEIVATAQDNVQRIVEDWQRRQEKMSIVKYVYEGDCVVPKGSMTGHAMLGEDVKGEVPPEDYRYKRQFVLLLDFERNRVRREVREERLWLPDGRFYPAFNVHLFDGTSFQHYMPAKENWPGGRPPHRYQVELDLQTDRYSAFVIENIDFPIFFAHGIFPSRTASISPALLRIPLERDWFGYHGEAPTRDGQCTVLRTQAFHSGSFGEYWVDPTRESAVIRYVAHSKGRPTHTADISHRNTEHGWMPEKWTLSRFDSKGGLERTETCEIKLFEPNATVEASDFHMDRIPGMLVSDVAANKSYRVGEPGKPDVDVAVLLAQDQSGANPWGWRAIVFGASLGLAIMILGWWLRFRRARTVK